MIETQPDLGLTEAAPARRNPGLEERVARLRGLAADPQPETTQPVEARTTGEVRFEIRHKSGVQATAVEEEGEFVVLEGSEALTGTGYVQQSYAGLKEKLVSDGVIVPQDVPPGSDRLRFARPWSFNSPSAAAAVVLDRNSNGRLEWKVKGASQTYHDWQQAQAERQEAAE